MISEGSCDTEDWSENSALPSQEKLHFTIKWKVILNWNISHKQLFLLQLQSNKCSLGEHKRLEIKKKKKKSYRPQTFEW